MQLFDAWGERPGHGLRPAKALLAAVRLRPRSASLGLDRPLSQRCGHAQGAAAVSTARRDPAAARIADPQRVRAALSRVGRSRAVRRPADRRRAAGTRTRATPNRRRARSFPCGASAARGGSSAFTEQRRRARGHLAHRHRALPASARISRAKSRSGSPTSTSALRQDFVAGYGEDEVDRPRLIATLQKLSASPTISMPIGTASTTPSNERLVNTLSILSPYGPEEKQALLEAPDLRARAEALVALAEMELAATRRRLGDHAAMRLEERRRWPTTRADRRTPPRSEAARDPGLPADQDLARLRRRAPGADQPRRGPRLSDPRRHPDHAAGGSTQARRELELSVRPSAGAARAGRAGGFADQEAFQRRRPCRPSRAQGRGALAAARCRWRTAG